jgi:uncharacterized protein involved in exopolysaccharide biosynthesis
MDSSQNQVSITRRPPDVEDYIDMLRRYRSWIVGPMFAGLVISVMVAFFWPDTYESTAILRITPQQIPEKLVESVINTEMAGRINQMQTEIESRTTLSEIIQKPALDLYKKERARGTIEDVLQEMRKAVEITPVFAGNDRRYGSAFQIKFKYPERYKAMLVVRELVNRFTEENNKYQTTRATVTTNFLGEQLKAAKERMEQKNLAVTKFRLENQGRLPEQVQANISAKASYDMQLMSTVQQIGRAQQDKLILENRLQTLKREIDYATNNLEMTVAGTQTASVRNQRLIDLSGQLSQKKAALASASQLLGARHPTIQALDAEVKQLEIQRDELEKLDAAQQVTTSTTSVPRKVTNPAVEKQIQDLRGEQSSVQAQLTTKLLDIDNLTKQQESMEKAIGEVQKRMAEAPISEQRYAELLNEANLAKLDYEDKVRKQSTSETAKQMEEVKAGENLEVVDPPNLPTAPTAPHRWAWAAAGTFFGFVAGVVLAAIKEVKNTSLKNLKDVRAYTNLPVLSSIPLLENALLVRRKRRLVWLAWSTSIILGCCLMGASFYYYLSNQAA